jgi:hypothetical protein
MIQLTPVISAPGDAPMIATDASSGSSLLSLSARPER